MTSRTSGPAIYEKPCSPLSAAAASDVSNPVTGRCLCSAELGRGWWVLYGPPGSADQVTPPQGGEQRTSPLTMEVSSVFFWLSSGAKSSSHPSLYSDKSEI